MGVSHEESEKKYAALIEYLRSLGSAAVAFSGGVDSSFLLMAAKEALGKDAAAVTVQSVLMPALEFEEAVRFCTEQGIRQIICVYEPLSVDGFAENTKERCYLCKKSFFLKVKELAAKQGIAHILEGSNQDDESDYRPGMRAVEELGIGSPLRKFGFTKADIRRMAREQGLSVWEKPSAACLASRIAYGETLTREKLSLIERAEDMLHRAGFSQVRVRMHGGLARIEALPEQMAELFGQREAVAGALRKCGFNYISLDLEGYRTGSMNGAD